MEICYILTHVKYKHRLIYAYPGRQLQQPHHLCSLHPTMAQSDQDSLDPSYFKI